MANGHLSHHLRLKLRNFRHSLRQLYPRLISVLPVLFLLVISLVLSYLNYTPGTWLTGWDNLHPEFDFELNIKRAIYAVWQEYQSLGLLGGMAHAADLPRVIFLYLFSIVTNLPNSFLRYFWTFCMLSIGPIAVYLTLHDFILHPIRKKAIVDYFDKETKIFAAFLGSLFYLLNLGTLQTFFLPFESFVSFYGLVPWLIYFLFKYLSRPSLRNLLLFSIFAFVSAPSFYVQTTFVVLSLFLFPFLFSLKPQISLPWLITLAATQAFWLLPVIFFVLTNSNVTIEAKNNLINTPETFMRNLEFANFYDIALLKGYWFNLLGYTNQNNFDYLLLNWRNHLKNPAVIIIGFSNVALIIAGVYYGLKKQLRFTKELSISLAICLFFLLGGVLIIGKSIPIVSELLRNPFTKFSMSLSYLYSIFFAIGTIVVMDLFSFLHHRLTYYLTLFTLSIGLVIFMTPAFTGNLISPQVRLRIPAEYLSLFKHLKSTNHADRIANFPQITHWGWNYFSWGYQGSGFLWYGINQPILDRAFDVWDKSSERYYEELSTALHSQDLVEFKNIISKYDVQKIIVDKYVINVNNLGTTYVRELEEMINQTPEITLEKNFNDKIFVYSVKPNKEIQNFLSLNDQWEMSSEHLFNPSLRPNIDFSITESNIKTSVKLGDKVSNSQYSLNIPSYTLEESLAPVQISYRKLSSEIEIKIESLAPILRINDEVHRLTHQPIFINIPLSSIDSSFILGLNNQYYELQLADELTSQQVLYPLVTSYLPSKDIIELSLYLDSTSESFDMTKTFQDAIPTQCQSERPNRTLEKIVNQKTVSIIGIDLNGCLSTQLPKSADSNSLISLDFEYSSSTNLHGNANITDDNYYSVGLFQPLIARNTPTFARLFSKQLNNPTKANLLLEAHDIKSLQEITYQNIQLRYLPLVFKSYFRIPQIYADNIRLPDSTNDIEINLPLVSSPYTVSVDQNNNLSSPSPLNCDKLNEGKFDKKTDNNGFLYSSTNADSCDQINLHQLPHQTSYLIGLDYQSISGLPTTICLENYSTRRCDVFERLDSKLNKQYIIQPIANPNEAPGYTLHLFNQSFGNRPTQNLIKSISVNPLPLNFLKSITLSSPSNIEGETPTPGRGEGVLSSTHPAEFLYTASIINDEPTILNLSQTKSSYWKALRVTESDLKLPTWLLIAKIPSIYLESLLSPSGEILLPRDEGVSQWFNSWTIPVGNNHLVIFYLPQYLQFIGFALLPLPLIIITIVYLYTKLHQRKNDK